jgi:hypothetical protein
MLMDAEAAAKAFAMLREAHFFLDSHRRIFRAMSRIVERGAVIDPMTLAQELGDSGQLDATGGKEYVGYIIDYVPTAANVEHHAAIVVQKYERREATKLLEMATEQLEAGKDLRMVRRQLDEVLDIVAPPIGRNELTLYDDEEIQKLPDAVPLIEHTLYEDSIAVLIGKYATLKTFVLLDMALCIGTGRAWHGRSVKKGAVVYIYAEGRAGIKKRVAAWKEANGHYGPANVFFVPMSVRLTDAGEVGRLLRLIDKRVKGSVSAVFVDTLARNMGGNENAPEDMGRFIAGCDEIRTATGATIIAAHHTGWAAADRARGSTTLPGAVNTELLIERDDYVLTITGKKQKDGVEELANITLEAFPVGDSLALRAVVANRPELTRNERAALNALQDDDGSSSTEWEEASGLAHGSYTNARKRLVALGYVKLRKKRYGLTDSGKLARGTISNRGTSHVQPVSPTQVQQVLSPRGENVVLGGGVVR